MLPKIESDSTEQAAAKCENVGSTKADITDLLEKKNEIKPGSKDQLSNSKTPSTHSIKILKRSITSISKNNSRPTVNSRPVSVGSRTFGNSDEVNNMLCTFDDAEVTKHIVKTFSPFDDGTKHIVKTLSPFDERIVKTSSPIDDTKYMGKTSSPFDDTKCMVKTSSPFDDTKCMVKTSSPFDDSKCMVKTSSPFDDTKCMVKTSSPFDDDITQVKGKSLSGKQHCQALHQSKKLDLKSSSKEEKLGNWPADTSKLMVEGEKKDFTIIKDVAGLETHASAAPATVPKPSDVPKPAALPKPADVPKPVDVLKPAVVPVETEKEKLLKKEPENESDQNTNIKKTSSPAKMPPKVVRSSIPRLSKVPATVLGSGIASPDSVTTKKGSAYHGASKIPRMTALMRMQRTNPQAVRKSTPNRSRTSTVSSRNTTPIPTRHSQLPLSSSVQAKSKIYSPEHLYSHRDSKQKDDKIRSMFEDTYLTLNKMRDSQELEKDTRDSTKTDHKPLDVIMPAKKGAGETVRDYRSNDLDVLSESIKKKESKESSSDVNSFKETLEQRTELLGCLSEMANQQELNFKDFDNLLEHYHASLPLPESDEMTKSFNKVDEAQFQLLQKLVKVVSDLYMDKEQLKNEVCRLSKSQDKNLEELESKLNFLQSENTGLVEKMLKLTAVLEAERESNSKRKNISQVLMVIKSKLSKAEQRINSQDAKYQELLNTSKRLDLIVKTKEVSIEGSIKRIKSVESVAEKLKEENKSLQAKFQEMKENEEQKMKDAVSNSIELKQTTEELSKVKEQLAEAVGKGETINHELQETSQRLHFMEQRCNKFSALINTAKTEINVKENEHQAKQAKLADLVNSLETELQARKVMLKVSEDEGKVLKSKLERLENKSMKDHEREKSSSGAEERLKVDLHLRDEQITQLQEQIKILIEKREPYSKSKHKLSKSTEKPPMVTEKVLLASQLVDMERSLDELAKDNLELQQIVNQKNMELEQRDRVVKMQTDVLKIRDELIVLLKNKEIRQEEDVKRLSDILLEREHAIEKEWQTAAEENWENRMSTPQELFGHNVTSNEMQVQKKMEKGKEDCHSGANSVYLTLEDKQTQLAHMQRRVQELENIQNAYNQQRTRQEARINQLEMALSEKIDISGLVPILAQ